MKGIYDAILQKNQADYLNQLLPAREGALVKIEEHAKKNGVPIVDPEVGLFLQQLVAAIPAQRVLEIGTATGYSGLHIAKALPDEGKLITIDIDRKRLEIAKQHFAEENLLAKVEFILGPALEILPAISGPFDLLFVDAIKEEYCDYLKLALPKLRHGAAVVCDNLLWSGQVAGKIVKEDERESTQALRKFNPWFMNHPQLLAQILPLGDGTGFGVKR